MASKDNSATQYLQMCVGGCMPMQMWLLAQGRLVTQYWMFLPPSLPYRSPRWKMWTAYERKSISRVQIWLGITISQSIICHQFQQSRASGDVTGREVEDDGFTKRTSKFPCPPLRFKPRKDSSQGKSQKPLNNNYLVQCVRYIFQFNSSMR